MITTIWSRPAISKAPQNLTFIDVERFFNPLGSLSLQVQNLYFIITLPAKPSKCILWEAVKDYL